MWELIKPFYRIWTAPPQYLHPVVIHFSIVLLILEAVLLGLFRVTKRPDYERWSFHCLYWSLWAIPIVAVAGLHDVGLDLGARNIVWLGRAHPRSPKEGAPAP
jgi:uncharacterized membrane protein